MTPPAAPAPQPAADPWSALTRALGVAGLACLGLITLASPGATRMFAWPWSLAFGGAVLTPGIVLVLRAFDPRRPLRLPGLAWCTLALGCAGIVLGSALASPYRGPSLLWSAPLLAALAAFFVIFDWLGRDPANRGRLTLFAGSFFAVITLTSLSLWLADLSGRSLAGAVDARNPFPLGHSNYTGGLALIALPCFAQLGLRASRPVSFGWAAAFLLALVMLVTSASRGALLGLGALALAALLAAPLDRRGKMLLGVGFALIGLALALAHPRTRAMFRPVDPATAPNPSNVQRTAMLTAGWRMGADRPVLGWGPGVTPLVYPRYRAGLDGGVDNVLQLHSVPVHLWAELGAAGVACAIAFAALAGRQLRRDPTTAATLAGYAVFALTDWQFDVPIFAFALATFAALRAADPPRAASDPTAPGRMRVTVGLATLLALATVALLGGRDPAPELNVRALALARDPANADQAIALLRQSLALNRDQEIVHFNLGWLLVARDPAAAEKHFLVAAHLVPDKGGVYFGLGLARLNRGRRAEAARAFALECLNDPAFAASPWWREPAIAAERDATRRAFQRLPELAEPRLPAGSWAAAQLSRVAALAPKLGEVPPGPERQLFRERTGYPVLVRNLDLPPPLDLYPVRESLAPAAAAALPAKGWLPTPLLLELLDAPAPPELTSPPPTSKS